MNMSSSQAGAGARLVRALLSNSPELSGIALAARTAIAVSDALPATIFQQLLRFQVQTGQDSVVFIACACAFKAAIAASGVLSRSCLHPAQRSAYTPAQARQVH